MSEADRSAPAGPTHWFEPIADHLGSAYLRYSFTKGTRQEIDHLMGALSLRPGCAVLDVGCGPGRHAYELARRGVRVHGIDISERFVDLASASAPEGATFERADARDLEQRADLHGRFDAVICLCQGAFGMMTAAEGRDGRSGDDLVIGGMAAALGPGGHLALSAFNAYFAVKYHTDATFDARHGVNHEVTEVRDESGAVREVDLWTGCYTPRELRLLLTAHGLRVDRISAVEPGAYGDAEPTTELPEFLVLATRTSR